MSKIKFNYDEFTESVSRLEVIPDNKQSTKVNFNKNDYIMIVPLEIHQRIDFINKCIIKTLEGSEGEVKKAVNYFCDWMMYRSVVRLIGAGRAKLAGAIPTNRLAHGGARIFIQDENIPMPHSILGGGIIAASASGKTKTVLAILEAVRKSNGNIKIVGIANKHAREFKGYCDVFIGIEEDVDCPCPLKALADIGEQVISELLDAIVVAAGKLAGFDDTRWRLGHEDIGATGPYGALHGPISGLNFY